MNNLENIKKTKYQKTRPCPQLQTTNPNHQFCVLHWGSMETRLQAAAQTATAATATARTATTTWHEAKKTWSNMACDELPLRTSRILCWLICRCIFFEVQEKTPQHVRYVKWAGGSCKGAFQKGCCWRWASEAYEFRVFVSSWGRFEAWTNSSSLPSDRLPFQKQRWSRRQLRPSFSILKVV